MTVICCQLAKTKLRPNYFVIVVLVDVVTALHKPTMFAISDFNGLQWNRLQEQFYSTFFRKDPFHTNRIFDVNVGQGSFAYSVRWLCWISLFIWDSCHLNQGDHNTIALLLQQILVQRIDLVIILKALWFILNYWAADSATFTSIIVSFKYSLSYNKESDEFL